LVTNNQKSVAIYIFRHSTNLLNIAVLCAFWKLKFYILMITADVLRVRTGPGTNYDIVKKVYRGERYQSWGMQNGWYNVAGDQWVSGEYVRFEGGNKSK